MSAIPLALRLVQARELADAGRPDEAERLLAPSPAALPEEPLALHTLAVIVTRRGDYPRARRLWQQLARIQPANREAAAMLEAVDDWTGRPAWMAAAPAVAALAVLLLVGLATAALRRPSAPPLSQATPLSPAYATNSAPRLVTPAAPSAYIAPAPQPPPAVAAQPAEEPAAVTFQVKPAKKR